MHKKMDNQITNALYHIQKDINRTLISELFKEGSVIEKLDYVLTNLARLCPQVGYCQGMNYIAALFLMVSGAKEQETVCVFGQLLDSSFYMFNLLFKEDLPLLFIIEEIIMKLMQKQMPKVYNHFTTCNISPSIWISKILLSGFVYLFDLLDCVLLWDYIFIKGTVLGYTDLILAMVTIFQDQLLTKDEAELSIFLIFRIKKQNVQRRSLNKPQKPIQEKEIREIMKNKQKLELVELFKLFGKDEFEQQYKKYSKVIKSELSLYIYSFVNCLRIKQQLNLCNINNIKNVDYVRVLYRNSKLIIQKEVWNLRINRYYNAFHFYFAKPISEILANLQIDHVILFKDLLYFNDDNDYLTKCYDKLDQKQIMSKLQFKIPIPNLLIVTAHQILQKRNNKLQKLQKQPVHNVAATNKYQILFNTTQNIDLSSEIEEYENRLISWETSEHNIYSTSNVSNNQIKPITQRLQSILNKSNSVHQLHYQQNDKDISMVFRDINKFTNRQLMKISPKQMVNKKSVKNNGKSKNQSKNTNVIVPKLRIPKIIDNKVNFQQLLNQYDQIMQQRYCQTERQSKSDKQQTNKGQLYNKQQQSIYSVPSSSNFPGKGLSTCSASLLLKSLSKMSMDKSPMTSRRLEIKQNLTNLIKQQERDMGFYTQR